MSNTYMSFWILPGENYVFAASREMLILMLSALLTGFVLHSIILVFLYRSLTCLHFNECRYTV